MATVVRLRRNGPLIVDGDDVVVVDWDGVERRPVKQPIALCRCGGSATKPFCDGSHRRNGFAPDPAAILTPEAGSREPEA